MDFQGSWRHGLIGWLKYYFIYESGTPTLEKCINLYIRGRLSSMLCVHCLNVMIIYCRCETNANSVGKSNDFEKISPYSVK
jgi:hypothetical protein